MITPSNVRGVMFLALGITAAAALLIGCGDSGTSADGGGRESFTILSFSATASGNFVISESASDVLWDGHGTGGSNPEPVPMYMVLHYTKEPEEFLRLPINAGAQWSGEVSCGGRSGWTGVTTVETMSQTLAVRAGTFSDCVRLKTVITGDGTVGGQPIPESENRFVRGTRYMWLAPEVGIVKIQYQHEDGTQTEIELTAFAVEPGKTSYFPLVDGNTWTYAWTNGYRQGEVTETSIVTKSGPGLSAEGHFSISETASDLIWTGYGTGGVNPEPVPMYMVYHYANSPAEFLRLPVEAAAQWSDEVSCGGRSGWTGVTTIEIMSQALAVPAGTFSDCVRLKTVITGEGTDDGQPAPESENRFVRGTRYIWLAPEVGIVKIQYQHEDGTQTEIELTAFAVESGNTSYFPLVDGNTWSYAWTNGYRSSWLSETCTVTHEADGEFTLSCWNLD